MGGLRWSGAMAGPVFSREKIAMGRPRVGVAGPDGPIAPVRRIRGLPVAADLRQGDHRLTGDLNEGRRLIRVSRLAIVL